MESLEDLRVLAVLPEQAAGRRADGSDLGGVAAAVRAHQQMESECEASPWLEKTSECEASPWLEKTSECEASP